MIVQKAPLLALLQSLSGLSGFAVSWEHDPQQIVNNKDFGQVKVLLRSIQGRGIDEARNVYDPLTDTIIPERYGNRDVILSIKAESFGKGAEACEVLDQIRSRLYRQSSVQALNALGLALQTIDAATDLPTGYDNRVVSVASMDLHLGGILVDAPLETADYIATVNTTDIVPWVVSVEFSGEAQGSSSAEAVFTVG